MILFQGTAISSDTKESYSRDMYHMLRSTIVGDMQSREDDNTTRFLSFRHGSARA